MAEAVVSVLRVLGKLAVNIANEAQFLGGVKKKVERVQRELIRIKSCLIDAHSKRKGDERVQNWLNELRDVAYRIEDAIDTFFLEVEGHRREDASNFQNHKLGNELDNIQNLLEEISKSRVTYGIKDLPLEDKSKGEAVKMPLRRATYSEVDENEVVGLQSDKGKPKPYELNLLNEGESLDLLLKKAFPYHEPDEEYPKDLLELAPELSEKCKGLPLALIVLGGILRIKEPTYPAWERVLRTMNWHSDGSNCMRILAMSYDDMSYHLKMCFQYLACFPEDYEISAESPIGMWVAEGFIPLEGTKTMEESAEDCLEELAERNMVQVLSRSVNGLIKRFKVHDILRELAMGEARHENFVTVFSHASNDTKPDRIIRRASLQVGDKNSQFIKYVGRNTRSLLLFGPQYCKTELHCSNFRLLKVLEITKWYGQFPLVLKSLDELIHLKYLGIRDCNLDISWCSLHRMRSLETLDVRQSSDVDGYKKLCDDFWSIGTLRHVRSDSVLHRPLPKCIDLNHLQTLKRVRVEGACDWKLPNLRKLGIFNNGNWVSITNQLKTLPLLVSLEIRTGGSLPMEIVYPTALPNYQNLQSLFLYGRWLENVNVEAKLFPPHLVKLKLMNSYLKQNPMPELGKLNSLKKLDFGYHAGGWKGPMIFSEGFPALQYLFVNNNKQGGNIKDLTVVQGVMPKLTYLGVAGEIEVHLPPELQHVRVKVF